MNIDDLLEKYANVPERHRYAAVAGAAVALVFAQYSLVFGGQQRVIADLQGQYQTIDAERTEKRAYADNLNKYEARLTQLQESLVTARAMLPDTADVAHLLAQIGTRGALSGLTIARFEPKGETFHDFYAELAFEMEVRGSYHEIATFIDSVGKLDRIVNVTDIVMREPKVENQKVIVEGFFMLKTYRFVPESERAENKSSKKKRKK